MPRDAKHKQSPISAQTNGSPVNGAPPSPARTEEIEDDQTDENIFLFIPNLIGEPRQTLPLRSSS